MQKTSKDHLILTKIIATLGPASMRPEIVHKLIDVGVHVFRVNFSHGTTEEFERALKLIRSCAEERNEHIAVLGDLSGPKIRIGKVTEGGVELPDGGQVLLQGKPILTETPTEDGSPFTFNVTLPQVLKEIEPNQRILLDDGFVELLSTSTDLTDPENPKVLCQVVHGGRLTSSKGVNLPDTTLTLPAMTEWDEKCVDFAVQAGFDFLALSFVRKAKDVRQLKDRLRNLGARPSQPKKDQSPGSPRYSSYGGGSRAFIPVISKIEKPQALEDLDAIVNESDMIMVARGDLGVEMDLASVPVIQKRIIGTCHDHGKPVIVATQMLQSMVENPTPTRAEVSDVATAIIDGADAVMMSGETAVGEFPVEAARMMRRIARRTNEYLSTIDKTSRPPKKPRESRYRTAALAHGVSVVVSDLEARLVILWSQLGGGASYLSQNRLPIPVIACSSSPEALRRMAIMYGVKPVFIEQPTNSITFLKQMDEFLLKQGWASQGDAIVLVTGIPIGQAGLTNEMRVHYVGED